MHCPGKGLCTGSCRAPASPPHLFINGVLRGQGTVKSGIFAPGACNVVEIALPVALPGHASTSGEGFNRHFVQAFAPLTGDPTKSFVQSIRNVADGVLHAYIVGIAGMKCKHEGSGYLIPVRPGTWVTGRRRLLPSVPFKTGSRQWFSHSSKRRNCDRCVRHHSCIAQVEDFQGKTGGEGLLLGRSSFGAVALSMPTAPPSKPFATVA